MAPVRNFFKRAAGSVAHFARGASASAADTTKGAFDSVVDVTRAALGSAVDITKEAVTGYVVFLKNLVRWSVLAAIMLLPLPVVGTVFHLSWMNGLYLLLMGLICTALLMAASPLIVLAQLGQEYIKPYRRMAQLRAGIAFWGLLVVIYFWLVPIWNYPQAIPLVLIICLFLAMGFVRFGIGLNPRLAVGGVLVLLVLITISFYFPASRAATDTLRGWMDDKIAGLLASPSHPSPKKPQRIACNSSSVETVAFFDFESGEPKAWYYIGRDGRIEVFDSPGHHPQYQQDLQAITQDIVAQFKMQVKADAAKAAEEDHTRKAEQRRREELLRIEREQSVNASQSRGGIDRGKTGGARQPPLIRAEDTNGQVERRRDGITQWQERTIEPEETNGVVIGRKGG